MDFLISLLQSYWTGPEFTVNIVVSLNLLGALILGLMVGYERSYRGRAAGMRTYGMVCMASAALMVVAGYPSYWYGGHSMGIGSIDPTRTVQGIVTGIGFLGAGIIMKDGLNISGLSTAASIWATAAIGILVGVGFYGAAIMLTLLSAGFMLWGGKIANMLPSRHAVSITMTFRDGFQPDEEDMHTAMLHQGYKIAMGSVTILCQNGKLEWRFVALSLGKARAASFLDMAKDLPKIEGVESFQLTHARN